MMEHKENINYPRFHNTENNPETALSVPKKTAKRRGLIHLGQDFLQLFRWSQLKRQFSWEHFNQISRRYATRLGLVLGLGYFSSGVRVDYKHKDTLQTANLLALNTNKPVLVANIEPLELEDLDILANIPMSTQQAYIKRFARLAQTEMRKYRVPASVIMGLAIWNSRYGTHELTLQLNNHFAINCPNTPTDTEPACFADYENAWASFRAQTLLLTKPPFSDMVELAKNDYKLWAAGLERLGYKPKQYQSGLLIGLIEKHGLERLDEK